MSDNALPIAVPTQFQPWQPTDEQVAKAAERARLQAQRNAEDAARAASPKVQRVAVTSFMMMGEEEFPNGRTINSGDTFEIPQFDLPKYVGKSLAA